MRSRIIPFSSVISLAALTVACLAPMPGMAQVVVPEAEPSVIAVAPKAEDAALQPVPDPLGADPADLGPVEIEVASFKGVTPGQSTAEEVEASWGAPKQVQRRDDTLMQLYAVEPFDRVEVRYFRNTISSIVVRFQEPFPVNPVAQQLGMANVRPVLVSDELGAILGQAYPERGVLFSFAPSSADDNGARKVSEIILEPITADPFVLRAETNLDSNYRACRMDLEQAIELQPSNARAHWLLCRALTAMGEFDKAVAAGGKAVKLRPSDPQYRVTRAQILGQSGKLEEAIQEAKQAVALGEKRPHIKARALCLAGDLMASGPKPDYGQAIQHHMEAVITAEPLAASRHPAIRRAAKEALIDAHLGAAYDVAWGKWQQKERSVNRWLDGAKDWADDLVANDQGSRKYRFRVGTRGLAACVGMRGALDPRPWAEEVIRVGEALIAASEDPFRKAQLQWDLGMALYDALQIYQMRNEHDTALKFGELAIEYLEKGNRQRLSATSNYLLGRLYFRLGAIHAIRDENHRVAITWFDKAVPLLKKPIPQEARADLGRHGEAFVSMAVSYWQSGQRDKAVDLTHTGVKLMEEAVKQGLLTAEALAVPYNNLASMLRHLGEDDEADGFQEMAERVTRSKAR